MHKQLLSTLASSPEVGLFGGGKNKSGYSALSKALFELGHSADEVVNEILALMVGATVELSIGSLHITFLHEFRIDLFVFLALTNIVNLPYMLEENG